MRRTEILSALLVGQAAVLLAAGVLTIGWSQSLMFLLIRVLGEEWALGARNVMLLPDGSKALTNPMAMMRWTLPFLGLGVVQITAALSLIWLWAPARSSRRGPRVPSVA